jgi:hypothetical protein
MPVDRFDGNKALVVKPFVFKLVMKRDCYV